MPNETFKIVSLEASNIKILKAVHITPDKNVITLSGANGAGKSSVLDSIAYALGGAGTLCDQPIRRGASKAEIICKLNGLTVTRKFGPTGTSLTVTNDEGAQQRSPQAILDALVGNLSFDPLAFSRMQSAQQLQSIQKLVGLDFTAKEQERARLYAERTVVNRDADRIQAIIASSPSHPDAPKEPLSMTELIEELNKAEQANRANEAARSDAARAADYVKSCAGTVKVLRKELERAQTRLDSANLTEEKAAKAAKEKAEVMHKLTDIDTAAIRYHISQSETINRKVLADQTRSDAEDGLRKRRRESTEITAKIEAIDKSKQDTLAKTKFPLAGLSFDDGAVLFNGLPLAQASDGEKLRISVAVGMALNPKLRVIFIRDGSLLDDYGLKTIAELAEKNDYQVWLEDARSTDPTALVIESGEIVTKEKQERETACNTGRNQ